MSTKIVFFVLSDFSVITQPSVQESTVRKKWRPESFLFCVFDPRTFPYNRFPTEFAENGNYEIPDKTELSDLQAHNLLFREKGSASRELLDNVFSLHHLSVSPMMESVSNEAILAAAAAGLGIAILPEGLISSYLALGQLRRIEITGINFDREYYMISHKNKKFSPLQRQIYDLFRTVIAKDDN